MTNTPHEPTMPDEIKCISKMRCRKTGSCVPCNNCVPNQPEGEAAVIRAYDGEPVWNPWEHRNAQQPPAPAVDWESLKKSTRCEDHYNDTSRGEAKGWNKCLDHLAASGHIGTGKV